MESKIDFSQRIVTPPTKLSMSKVIPSMPGAFLHLNSEMAVNISSYERGEDISSLHIEVSDKTNNGETKEISSLGTTLTST